MKLFGFSAVDAINDNDEQERTNDLKKKVNDLEQARQDLENLKNSHSKKIIGAGGNVEYGVDEKAIAEAEKKVKDAEDEVKKAKSEAIINSLEKDKKALEQQKDDSNESYESQLKVLEAQKESTDDYYERVIARLDSIIDTDKQTESNTDAWEEIEKTDTTVSTDNGVTTIEGRQIPSSQNNQNPTLTANPQPVMRENDILDNKNQSEKQTFSPTVMNDFLKLMGAKIPTNSDLVNIFPDITKSLFDNILKNTSSSIANTSNIINNGGENTTITVNIPSGITINNPTNGADEIADAIISQLPSAIMKKLNGK